MRNKIVRTEKVCTTLKHVTNPSFVFFPAVFINNTAISLSMIQLNIKKRKKIYGYFSTDLINEFKLVFNYH